MASQTSLKHAATEPSHLAGKGSQRRTRGTAAAGRAAVLRRAPSDSDCSGETGSLSADSGDKPPSTVRAAPPPVARGNNKRSRRRGSEWEVLEGLKDGQRFEKRPEVFNGYLHKKRKWPLKGWHKRYFVVDGGILVYARGPADVARGRLHGSVDVGLSVVSAKQRRRRIDIDADEFIYHLRAKTPELFRAWLNVLKQHRLYRQHLLTFGVRESAPRSRAPDDVANADSASRFSVSESSQESFSSMSFSGSDLSAPQSEGSIRCAHPHPETFEPKHQSVHTYTQNTPRCPYSYLSRVSSEDVKFTSQFMKEKFPRADVRETLRTRTRILHDRSGCNNDKPIINISDVSLMTILNAADSEQLNDYPSPSAQRYEGGGKRFSPDHGVCLSDCSLGCNCRSNGFYSSCGSRPCDVPCKSVSLDDLMRTEEFLKCTNLDSDSPKAKYGTEDMVYCVNKNSETSNMMPYALERDAAGTSKAARRRKLSRDPDPVLRLSRTKVLSTFFKFKTRVQNKQRSNSKTFYKSIAVMSRSKKSTNIPKYRMNSEPLLDENVSQCFLLTQYVKKMDKETSYTRNEKLLTYKKRSYLTITPPKISKCISSDAKNFALRENFGYGSVFSKPQTQVKQMPSIELNSSECKRIAERLNLIVIGLDSKDINENDGDKATELFDGELIRQLSNIENKEKNIHPTIGKIIRLMLNLRNLGKPNKLSKSPATQMVATKSINVQPRDVFQKDKKISTKHSIDNVENTEQPRIVKSVDQNVQPVIPENAFDKEATAEEHKINSKIIEQNVQPVIPENAFDKEATAEEHKINSKIIELPKIQDEEKSNHKNSILSEDSNDNSEKVLHNFVYIPDKSSQADNTSMTLNKRQLDEQYEIHFKLVHSGNNVGNTCVNKSIVDPYIILDSSDIGAETNIILTTAQNNNIPKLTPSPDLNAQLMYERQHKSGTKGIDAKFIFMLMENLTHLTKDIPSLQKDITSFYSQLKAKSEFNSTIDADIRISNIKPSSHKKVKQSTMKAPKDSMLLYKKSKNTQERFISFCNGLETFSSNNYDTLSNKSLHVIPSCKSMGTSYTNAYYTFFRSKSVLAKTDNKSQTTSMTAIVYDLKLPSDLDCHSSGFNILYSGVRKTILPKSASFTPTFQDDALVKISSLDMPWNKKTNTEPRKVTMCSLGVSAQSKSDTVIPDKELLKNISYNHDQTTSTSATQISKEPTVTKATVFPNRESYQKNVILVYKKSPAQTTPMTIEDQEQLMSRIVSLLPPIPDFKSSREHSGLYGRNINIYCVHTTRTDVGPRGTRSAIAESVDRSASFVELCEAEIWNSLSRRSSEPSGLGSPTSGAMRGPQAGFVSGTPGGRLGSWVIEPGGTLETVSRELGQAQLSVQQLQRLLEALELQQQTHHDTDVSLEGASPSVKKDRRKFGLRKKKSQSSKGGSVDLQLPHHMDASLSHSALSALTAPPSPGGGASSMPNSAASLPIEKAHKAGHSLPNILEEVRMISQSSFVRKRLTRRNDVACAAARPQSLPGTESLGPASLASLTPDHQLREDFTVLAKDLVSSLKSIVCSLLAERGRREAEPRAGGAAACALRGNLSAALQQNSELKSRLARIHDASDIADLSAGPNSDLASRQFQPSLSYSSSCVSASEFFDAEEHEDDADSLKDMPVEGGVIELEGDTSSEAGSLTSEEGSASSDNSDAALLNAESGAMTISENGLEAGSAGAGWVRRTRLPRPRPTPGGPSLWNLLYKNIGKDLSQVSMPVTINEPLNMLQRLCEELEYSELLDAAAACGGGAGERLALVAAFAVSAYAAAAHRAASKPFNPLLGETYECVREDRGFRFVAEQVSHHPPISVCHAESPRWTFWQEARIKTKFWGKSMEFQPAGRVHVRLHTTGDHYSWNKVTTCVHNLFGGQRWVDQYGDMQLTTDTKLNCKLNFIKASSWSATRHEVRGAVAGGAGRPLRLAGRWSEALYAGDPPAAKCLWRPGAMPPENEVYYGFTRFAMELNEMEPGMRDALCHTDTRLRPDQRALEEGDVDTAERLKSQLEQSQRERRRDYPNHHPRWFRKGTEDTGEEVWVFGGEYWAAREAGFPGEAAPRIW